MCWSSTNIRGSALRPKRRNRSTGCDTSSRSFGVDFPARTSASSTPSVSRRSSAGAHMRWFLVVVFAIGMAWVEAASVYYLRAMTDRIEPYQQNPLPMRGVLGPVELVREGATLVMLFTVGALAGRTWRQWLGYTAFAFGVWDILYYLFLLACCEWPKSVLA